MHETGGNPRATSASLVLAAIAAAMATNTAAEAISATACRRNSRLAAARIARRPFRLTVRAAGRCRRRCPWLPEYRPPDWVQAPENYMPATVALDALVVRRDDLAVWIADALVYPTGLVLSVITAHRYGSPPDRPRHPWFFHPGDPEGPRFGVGFADGRRGSTGVAPGRAGGPPDIVLTHSGGAARSGAERAVELWPDERPSQPPSNGGGWVAYGAG